MHLCSRFLNTNQLKMGNSSSVKITAEESIPEGPLDISCKETDSEEKPGETVDANTSDHSIGVHYEEDITVEPLGVTFEKPTSEEPHDASVDNSTLDESHGATVECVIWSLCGTLYKFVYPFAAVWYGRFSSARNAILGGEIPDLPERIIHAGIIIHGHVYEYTTVGVKKSVSTPEDNPGSMCEVDGFLERKVLGTSNISLWDFDSWVKQQKLGRYGDDRYCVVNNQCCHFVLEVCKFLEVEPPSELESLCRYTERNENLVLRADEFTRSTAASNSCQRREITQD